MSRTQMMTPYDHGYFYKIQLMISAKNDIFQEDLELDMSFQPEALTARIYQCQSSIFLVFIMA